MIVSLIIWSLKTTSLFILQSRLTCIPLNDDYSNFTDLMKVEMGLEVLKP